MPRVVTLVDRDLPGSGWGQTAVADLDRDGRLAVTSGPESGRTFPWAAGEPLLARGDPEEAWVYLSSPAADYVHGSVVTVDGGWMGR